MERRPLLEIIYPTFNNPACIEYFLGRMKEYKESGFDFTISVYDSSESNQTEEIVSKFNLDNLNYHRLAPSTHIDEKTIIGLKQSQGKYVLLGGDGNVTRIDNIFANIDLLNSKEEIILIYNPDNGTIYKRYYNNLEKYVYTDKDEFFKFNYWYATFYGGALCLGEMLNNINMDKMLELFLNCNLIYPNTMIASSKGPYKVYMFNSYEKNPYKNGSGWINNKTALEIWAEKFCKSVSLLSPWLKKETIDYILKNTNKSNGFFTVKGFMSLRSTGNLSFRLYKKYKNYLKICSACPLWIVKLISLTPKFIFVVLRKIYKIAH